MKAFFKKNWIYFAAVLIPLMVLLFSCFVNGIWINKNTNILAGDAIAQEIPFLREFWNKLHNGGSLMYTWNIGGGYDLLSLVTYFVSPFRLLYFISSIDSVEVYLQIEVIFWWLMSSFSTTLFFAKTNLIKMEKGRKVLSLCMGLIFCLGSGMIGFLRYYSFSCVTACIPFLLLLLEKLVYEKKWKLYCIILAYITIVSFYLTFSVCILLFLWFLFVLKQDFKLKKYSFVRFARSSITSVIIAAFPMVLTYIGAESRLSNQTGDRNEILKKLLYIKPRTFFYSLLPLEGVRLPYMIAPNIYCTIMVAVLVIVYLLSKNKHRGICAIFAFFLLGFFVGGAFLLLHCFNEPNGVYFRFSNIFVFLALFMVMKVFENFEVLKFKNCAVALLLAIIGWSIVFFSENDFDSKEKIYIISLFLIVFYGILLILNTLGSIKTSTCIVLMLLMGLLELFVSSYKSFSILYYRYDTYDEGLSAIVADLDCKNGERVVFPDSGNDGLLYNVNTLDAFASTLSSNTWNLFSELGCANNPNVVFGYTGNVPLINDLLNVKYIIAYDDDDVSYEDGFLYKQYPEYGYNVYRVGNDLGIAYMVDKEVLNWQYIGGIPFITYNDFLSRTTGVDGVFALFDPQVVCEDAYGEILENTSGSDGLVYSFGRNYVKGEDNGLYMHYKSEYDLNTFIFVFNGGTSYNLVSIDGETVGRAETGIQDVMYIGHVNKDDLVELYSFPLTSDFEYIDLEFVLSAFSSKKYKEAIDILAANKLEIVEFKDTYIKGCIDVKESGILMTSVQNQKGFDVYVDGEVAEIKNIGGAYIGVELNEGYHTVEISYHSPGVNMAIALSVVGALIFVATCVVERKLIKKQKIFLV